MSSRSLNRIILIGNLTRDPELKYTPAGTAVCTFGVATNRSWTTNDGQTKEETQFHRVVAWQKLAELCGKLLTKGRKIYMEGRMTYRTFVGKDSVQRTIAEIVLDDFIVFGDPKKTSETVVEKTETEKPTSIQEEEPAIPVVEINNKKTVTPAKDTVNEEVNPDDIPF